MRERGIRECRKRDEGKGELENFGNVMDKGD